jgi:phage terminase large subunit
MNAMNLDKSCPFYCDSAEPARIEELKEAGYNAIAADKSVKDGIDYVKRHRLNIDPNSSNILMEIPAYSYRKQGEQVLDEPVKFRDHSMDAIRYELYTHSKLAGGEGIPDELASFGGISMTDDRRDKYGY